VRGRYTKERRERVKTYIRRVFMERGEWRKVCCRIIHHGGNVDA
jgi:hypothetical protein